jgi:hypothetical protein
MKMTRFVLLAVLAACPGVVTAGARAVPAVPERGAVAAEQATSLGHAVRDFNKRAPEYKNGKEQPPLTEEEVIAALRWAVLHRKDLPISEETRQTLERITETKQLPPKFDLELLTDYEPDGRVVFEVWSIRLRVPREPHGTYAITIREAMIRSRVMGPEERKVVSEWSRIFSRGFGSFERVEKMRQYREERQRAMEKDRSQTK